MKPFAHTAAVVGSRFLLLVFLLLVALAQPARAQTHIPQQGCGNENETPCPIELFNARCDTGLQPSLYTSGCLIPNPFGGCLLPKLSFRCTNLSRRLGSVDPFLGGWTDWALKNQRELAQDEPLNWVTQISTHNSYNTWADGHALIDFPNQIYSTTDQLRLGMRAITFDNYFFQASGFPGARLCHSAFFPSNPFNLLTVAGLCANQLGNLFYPLLADRLADPGFPVISPGPSDRYYSNGIKEIRNWLDQNPNEIVFLDFEEYVPRMPGGQDEDVLAPIRAYLGDMVFTPPPPVPPASVTGSIATASFMGSITNGVLKVDAPLSGTLHVGDQINGASIPPGTFIQSFSTGTDAGTGGTGTYNLNQASLTVVPSETITTGVLTVAAVGSGKLHVDDQITGKDIPDGTFIQSFGTGTGGTGTYNLNKTSVTGSITNGVLTVEALGSGALYVPVCDPKTGLCKPPGDQITGTGIPDGTFIGGFRDNTTGGTGPFGMGVYDLSTASLTVPSETITTTLTVPSETINTVAADSGRFPDRWPTRR